MTWTDYSDGNNEDAEIIIVLIKKEKLKSNRPGFDFLKAVHATFPPEFQRQISVGTAGGSKSHC